MPEALVTVGMSGSRDFGPGDAWKIWQILAAIENETLGPFLLLNGECPYGGADLIVSSWAAGAGWEVEGFPSEADAGWAYAKRNQAMVDRKPDLFLFFFKKGAGNRGTKMTRDMAKKAGLNVREYEI